MLEHYAALRRAGVDVDVIDEEQSLEPYKIVATPMMYLVKPGVLKSWKNSCPAAACCS